METNSNINLPDGHLQTVEIIHDLQGIRMTNKDPMIEKSLRTVIGKSYSLIESLNYKPKLPLYQIDQAVISLCNQDSNLHGVHIELLFTSRSENTDFEKMGVLTVKIEKK